MDDVGLISLFQFALCFSQYCIQFLKFYLYVARISFLSIKFNCFWGFVELGLFYLAPPVCVMQTPNRPWSACDSNADPRTSTRKRKKLFKRRLKFSHGGNQAARPADRVRHRLHPNWVTRHTGAALSVSPALPLTVHPATIDSRLFLPSIKSGKNTPLGVFECIQSDYEVYVT